MLRYKIDVLWELKVRHYPTTRLRNEKLIGEGTINQLRNDKMISTAVLNKLCAILEMQPGDIIEYVPDETEEDTPLFAASSTDAISGASEDKEE